jgi:hypothetical protein
MKFTITVARTVFFYEKFEIEADNREDAKRGALDEMSYLTNDKLSIAGQEEFVNEVQCDEEEEY